MDYYDAYDDYEDMLEQIIEEKMERILFERLLGEID